ncbi:LacI family DNA-binding transcriptional regulator [Echinicola jeungdonensis]|uniref:LacI family DNA-binding transcriptional regulator n=1 Tax=Echinicola jeungdonensis TaxID=709343 RepID=A0ABV5JAW4_9BACT|nr:LacI family DNA-binding transcriptional regulator [Echinicola jeungdonensis]MDN3670489.1 LacI family DNA-binding transcriptional regulator [Echinicola jeungdonensis]
MGKKKISITDIAKELNVSITTVSFILNNKAKNRISDEVIKKVQDYVKKVGYQPNQLAQGLRTGKSKIIVFMVEDISDAFFSSIARLMEGKAYDNGYKLIFCSTENDKDKARDLIRLFKDRQVDGYIITPPADFEQEIHELLEEDFPVVLFDRYFEELDVSHVIINNQESAFNSVKNLVEGGFRNIGYVTLESNQSQMKDRLSGYEKAIDLYDLPKSIFKVSFKDFKAHRSDELVETYLKENPQLDALFFATNYLAKSGLKVLKKKGVKIPEQIGVVSFDDSDVFELYTPTITSLSQPIESIADKLMEIMLKQLTNIKGRNKIIHAELPGSLIVRESSHK